MSIKCMNYVWEHSETTGADRLMLLALADSCNDDGEWSPGVSRLADKCKVSERAAQYTLRRLEELGEIKILHQQGFKTKTGHTNKYVMARYRLHVGLERGVQPVAGLDNDGVKPIAPHKREGVKPIAPVGVQPIAPESSVLPTSNTLPTRSDQGEGSKIVAPPPTPTTQSIAVAVNGHSKPQRIANDSYDLLPSQSASPPPQVAVSPPAPGAATQAQLQRWAPQVEPRKFVRGYIPAGKGETPTEIWYESFSVTDAATRLTAPDQDDLRACTDLAKLRTIITTFRQCDFHRKRNIRLILDWYRDGIPEKYRGKEQSTHANQSTAPAPAEPTGRYAKLKAGKTTA